MVCGGTDGVPAAAFPCPQGEVYRKRGKPVHFPGGNGLGRQPEEAVESVARIPKGEVYRKRGKTVHFPMVAQCGLLQKALRRHPALASRGKVPRIPAKPVHFPLRFAQVNPIRHFRYTCGKGRADRMACRGLSLGVSRSIARIACAGEPFRAFPVHLQKCDGGLDACMVFCGRWRLGRKNIRGMAR